MLVEILSKIALLGSEWVLYLLIGLSVLSLTAVLERWLFFRRNARGAGDALRSRVRDALLRNEPGRVDGILAASPSVQGRVLRASWAWRRGGSKAVLDAIESELGKERPGIERSSTLLGTVGNNAPFIGLFGTVIGVIVAFHHLGGGGGKDANMASVMSGIAEALIATGVGIFVAIPAVIAFNLVQRQAGIIENEVYGLGRLLSAWLESHPEGVAGGPEASEALARPARANTTPGTSSFFAAVGAPAED
ncbi:MAG: hypothetical protein AMXMBFR64_40990 [Myxococcales bacterium]